MCEIQKWLFVSLKIGKKRKFFAWFDIIMQFSNHSSEFLSSAMLISTLRIKRAKLWFNLI